MRNLTFPLKKYFPLSLRASICGLPIIFCFLLLFSCASYKLEKTLDPDSREFLSKVRYIVTKQERKIFLNLPPSERKRFIEEFWKKRDPDPETEENEFKRQYFSRIEEANHLFSEGGRQGWLQDRGRIYILLGPPEQREAYPRGYSLYGKPIEIWYYGFFPIVFIDRLYSGNYELDPLSARHISEINKAQIERKPKVEAKKVVLDFSLKMKKTEENEAVIRIAVPYKNIWFREEDKKLETILRLSIEIFDSSGKRAWECQENYPVSLTEENLEEKIGENYLIEIPVNLEKGNYTLAVELENKTDKNKVMKKTKFVI